MVSFWLLAQYSHKYGHSFMVFLLLILRVMGPFIVMLGKIVGDVLRFLFLYAEIYVPYACAFWIIFGGDVNQQIQLS